MRAEIQRELFAFIARYGEPLIGKNIAGYPTYTFEKGSKFLMFSFSVDSVFAISRWAGDEQKHEVRTVKEMNKWLAHINSWGPM